MEGEYRVEIVSIPTPETETEKQVTHRELQRAAMQGDWDAAKLIFDEDPNAKTAIVSVLGLTALHVAASCGRSEFVEKLVSILCPQELEMRDQVGRTALHHVALAANVRAAEAMVYKNPNLPQLGDKHSYTPLLYAAQWRHPSKTREMLEFLYQVTTDESPCQAFTGPSSINLILAITASGSHDITLRLLARCPDLALKKDEKGKNILHVLAMQPSAFRRPNPFRLKWFLSHWKRTKTKQRRTHSIEIAKFVCEELTRKPTSVIMDYFLPANYPAVLQLATENGVFELVEVCLNYFPDIIWLAHNGRLPLHDAIEHRQVDIFNYIVHLIGENTKTYADLEVQVENNILHLAAKSPPSPQLLSMPNPALQLQQELQWFKAVEALVYDDQRVAKNSDGKTPGALFCEEHKSLQSHAKKWMKDTSTSCMAVAILVTTVAFAGTLTVPGGIDERSGLPTLSKKHLFVAYSISNAVSMTSAAISLLMFLSVQTSRQTEKDYLKSLPKIFLQGLMLLFISVVAMMIAFGTAIGLSFSERVNWAYIPIMVAASCPAIIFTKLQLPLIFDIRKLTSGHRMFQMRQALQP